MKMKRNQNYCKKNFCKRCPGTKISLRCLGTQQLLCWFPGILSTISYQTRKADHLDLSPFDGLMTEAVEMGVKLITAAYSYRSGVISEDELRAVIGNRSYAGGEPEG